MCFYFVQAALVGMMGWFIYFLICTAREENKLYNRCKDLNK